MTSTLIIILIGIASTVGKGLLEYYKKKQAALEIERVQREREQAILRTGRDPATERPASIDPAVQREAELMAQRQEALRELRRQQAGESTGGGEGGTVRRQLWPGGPVVEVRVPGGMGGAGQPVSSAPSAPPPPMSQRRQPEFRPQGVPSGGQQRPTRPQQTKQQKKGRQQQQQQVRTSRSEYEESGSAQRERTIERLRSAPAPEPVVVARPVELPRTRDQWRAALIAAEVLGPPVGLRGPVGH
ncbi:MAG: hypothetical protein QM783_17095 [Phycisphaerales bacterium]